MDIEKPRDAFCWVDYELAPVVINWDVIELQSPSTPRLISAHFLITPALSTPPLLYHIINVPLNIFDGSLGRASTTGAAKSKAAMIFHLPILAILNLLHRLAIISWLISLEDAGEKLKATQWLSADFIPDLPCGSSINHQSYYLAGGGPIRKDSSSSWSK